MSSNGFIALSSRHVGTAYVLSRDLSGQREGAFDDDQADRWSSLKCCVSPGCHLLLWLVKTPPTSSTTRSWRDVIAASATSEWPRLLRRLDFRNCAKQATSSKKKSKVLESG